MAPLEWLSFAINLAAGIYFAVFFPRRVRRIFTGRRTPRGFALLSVAVRVLGWVVIAGTVGYVLVRLVAAGSI